MKRIIFILTLSTFLFTQQAEITNIQASQRTDGSQIVDITYDLLPDPVFEFFEISVLVSLDGGQSYTNMSNVSGDLGEIIEPGNGKILTWNFGQQFGETYSDQIKIKIQGSSYALVNNNSNQELPFEMVTVSAGEYTFGENDEIRTIDYDYEIMKYEVTDQDYVLFMMDKLSSGELDCSEPILCGPDSEQGYILDCDGTGECWHPAYIADGFCDGNDQPYGANLCCYNLDGGDCTFAECVGSTDCLLGGYDSFVNDSFFGGYYPGDANHPAGDYNFIEFSKSKISYNGIFEVQEGNVNHPVTGVTWFGAWAFATHYGMEVPDQYEWEKAARGNTGYDYPWGDEISSINANYNDFFGSTSSIGLFDGNTQLNLPDYSSGYYESSIPNAFWYKKVDDLYYFYYNKDCSYCTVQFNFDGQLDCNGGNNGLCLIGIFGMSIENGNHFYSTQGSCSNVNNLVIGDGTGSQLEFILYPDVAQTINSISATSENSVSPYGAYDMAGNVWEIVKNDDDSYFIRGGSYNSITSHLQSSYQESYNSSSSANNIGFRCMRKINQSQSRAVPKEKLKEYYLNKKNNSLKSNIKK